MHKFGVDLVSEMVAVRWNLAGSGCGPRGRKGCRPQYYFDERLHLYYELCEAFADVVLLLSKIASKKGHIRVTSSELDTVGIMPKKLNFYKVLFAQASKMMANCQITYGWRKIRCKIGVENYFKVLKSIFFIHCILFCFRLLLFLIVAIDIAAITNFQIFVQCSANE